MEHICKHHYYSYSTYAINSLINGLQRQLQSSLNSQFQNMSIQNHENSFQYRLLLFKQINYLKKLKQIDWQNQRKTILQKTLNTHHNHQTNVSISYIIKDDKYEKSYYFEDKGKEQLLHMMKQFGMSVFKDQQSAKPFIQNQ